jgi:hypothetical protein|tara:strand:- start:1077 stop:1451 length:375 start_codon:yes stop_codon:yes gene_type:complete
MRIKFLFEWELIPDANYRPVGLWVLGVNDLLIRYVDGKSRKRTDSVLRRVRAQMRIELQEFPASADLLEYHAATLSPYIGDRGPLIESERFEDEEEALAEGLSFIRREWDDAGRRWRSDLAALL